MSRDPSDSPLADAAVGAAAGAAASLPMLLAMQTLKRRSAPLPPREVAVGVTERIGLRAPASETGRRTLTGVSHVGYGAAVGVPFGLASPRHAVPAVLGGAVWGLTVWAASYAGWLPAAGILPPPRRRSAERNRVGLGSHLVWGAVLGGLVAVARRRGRP